MRMFAIIDRNNEGFFYNLENKKYEIKLNEQCLLPTIDLTIDYIEDHLTCDEDIAMVLIHQMDAATGTIAYTAAPLRSIGGEVTEA